MSEKEKEKEKEKKDKKKRRGPFDGEDTGHTIQDFSSESAKNNDEK